MLAKGLQQLDPPANSVVLIENVGNLVCPALFDLGERSKVVIASVTEGDDKPIKYPHMFRQSDVMILNKIDLLPYVPFERGPLPRLRPPGQSAASASSRCRRSAAMAWRVV